MINLRDILELINFRRIEPELKGMYEQNSDTVRIHTDFKNWFEFGVYDFGYEGDRDSQVEKILTKELLEREVIGINHVDELPIIAIWLDESKE